MNEIDNANRIFKSIGIGSSPSGLFATGLYGVSRDSSPFLKLPIMTDTS